MKRTILAITVAIAAMLFTACGNSGTPKSGMPSGDDTKLKQGDLNQVVVERYSFNDSIFVHDTLGTGLENGYSRFAVAIDIPVVENDALRKAIFHWILGSDTEDYVAVVMEQRSRFYTEEGGEVPNASFCAQIEMVDQSEKYVTYVNSGESYSAITHVNPWREGATFVKADGSVIGYDMFEQPEQLAGMVEKALLANDVFEGAEHIPGFQMPSKAPWIEKDCMVFRYGTYEIGSFADGEIECKVPVADMKPYLSEKGKALFE